MKIGITERGDGGLDQSWRNKLKTVDGAIIITKAPQLLLKEKMPTNTIIHCTITGFGGTIIEPNVKNPSITLNAYKQLKMMYGTERIVLRIDPIITEHPTPALNILKHADKNDRIRISFLDAYPHVRNRFNEIGIKLHQPFHAYLNKRQEILKLLPTTTEICGEPGMKCTGCISQRDINAMNIDETIMKPLRKQRENCECCEGKTELLTNKSQCAHKCVYCYWK
jgi:DNA repair photolyase